MLRLPPFEYQAPNSIAEAVALKSECGDSAMFVSGGTDFVSEYETEAIHTENTDWFAKISQNFAALVWMAPEMD